MSGPNKSEAWDRYAQQVSFLACADCRYLIMTGEGRCAAHDVNRRCIYCERADCNCVEEGGL